MKRFIFVLALLVLVAAAWAQTIEVDYSAIQCAPLVGDDIFVEVTAAPDGAAVAWGDGTLDAVPAGDGRYSHVYASPGDVTIELQAADGSALDQTDLTLYEHALTPTSSRIAVGETLEVVVSALPDDLFLGDGGAIDWGDGSAPTEAKSSGSYTHIYALPGDYTVTLFIDFEPSCVFATTSIEVAAPSVSVDPAQPRIDQPVSATVTDEPVGGSLDWGEGTVTPLDGSGSYTLPGGYPDDTTYSVTVTSAGGEVLTSEDVTVRTPQLAVAPSSVGIGEEVAATVTDGPENGVLDWGDGTSVTGLSGDEVLTHSYSDAGTYQVTLARQTGEVVASRSVGVDAPTFEVSPSEANTGETVTAQVSNEPSGGEIDWGDGSVTPLTGAGFYEHSYGAGGVYEVTLYDGTGAALATASVSIVEPTLAVTPTSARLSEPVTAEVSVAGSATLDWGDGESSAVSGTDAATHRYADPGDYTLALVKNGVQLAEASVTVLEPGLERLTPDPVGAGETVTLQVTHAPFEAALAWGDGARETAVTDGTYDHSYGAPGSYSAELIDTFQGRTVASLTVEVAEVQETLTVTDIEYNLAFGEIYVGLLLDNLIAGQDYTVRGGDFERLLFDVNAQETLTADLRQEGTVTFELVRNATGEVRATETVELLWPRPLGAESIAILSEAPHLEGDFIEFELSGLDPDYTYVFALDDPSGFERVITGATSWREIAVYDAAGLYQPTLRLQLPGGQEEVRDFVALDVQARTGEIAIRDDRVPYGLDTVFDLSSLVPGARYRIDFSDGQVTEFTAFSESETVTHRYTSLPNPIVLESYVEGAGIWELVDVAETPPGMTLTGNLVLERGGTVLGPTQTFVASELVPGERYRMRVSRGTVTGETGETVVEGGTVTADANGQATFQVTLEGAGRDSLFARLDLVLGDDEVNVDSLRFALPPAYIRFNIFVVEVTSLAKPFEEGDLSNFSGEGVLKGLQFDYGADIQPFTIAGREQDSQNFLFSFSNVVVAANAATVLEGTASLTAPAQAKLPARLSGLELTFSEMTLVRSVGETPTVRGSGNLLGVPFDFSLSGIFSDRFNMSGELLIPASTGGSWPIGDTGWTITGGAAIIDLSPRFNYDYRRQGGTTTVAVEAYEGWRAIGEIPDPAPDDGAWTGVFFLPNQGTVVQRDDRSGGRFGLDGPDYTLAVAWTASGFQLRYRGPARHYLFGWDVEILSPYTVMFKDSAIVAETPMQVLIDNVPFFEKPYVLELKADAEARPPVAVSGSVPIARDFGLSAVIADQPRLELHPQGGVALVFDRAAWTIDSDFAADSGSLDATLASSIREDVPPDTDLPQSVRQSYDDTLATLDTAENLLRLQLPLDGLTVTASGDVSLKGATWQTLARTPELDMYGFPYMSGGSAEIGIKRDGDSYALGLRGKLSLGGIVRANAAPSWYYVRDGREVRWEFEGVSVALGDPNGLIDTPATFSLTVGGLVSLEEGDESLEFNGAGELTVGFTSRSSSAQSGQASASAASKQLVNIEVAGVFGLNDSGAEPEPYWFVWAGTDLAEMGTPIPVKVKGVDVFAFYVFRGGIGHNLRLDQRTGNAANETCAVDDGFVGPGDDARPSVVKNARQCFDADNELALLAGTVIGYYQQNIPSELYGFVWHLNANLTVNSSGQVILGGRGWAMKNLGQGYRADATPNLMARLSGDENAILGSFCAGRVGRRIGELDCTALEPVLLQPAGFKLLEANVNAELKASWSSGEYYFALGRQANPAYLFVFPDFVRGYFVSGYITSPGVIEGAIPAGGIWASMYRGMAWEWRFSQDALLCTFSAYANAYFEFGGAIGVQLYPSTQFSGTLGASAGASGGASCGKAGFSIGASMIAIGTVTAPDPFQFSGSITVTADLPIIGDILVTVPATLSL